MNALLRQQLAIARIRNRLGTKFAVALAAFVLIFGVLPAAQASLIATDSFLTGNPADPAAGEYSVTQLRRSELNGAGQDPAIAGFTGPWTGNVTSGSLAVAQWTAESAPTGSTIDYQQGGRARFAGLPATGTASLLQRRVERALSPYTPSDTYYVSLITQIATGDAAGEPGFVGAGFTNTGSGNTAGEIIANADANMEGGSGLRGFLIGAASSDGVTTDFVVRHVGSTGVVQNEVIAAGIDNVIPTHTIVRIDFNDDPGNPNGNSKLTVWHNPADYSSEAAATASVAPLEFRTFALDTNADITHLTLTGFKYSKAASFDEPRFATSWDGALAVPEPAAAWMALSGMALAVAARSRRSRSDTTSH